MQPFSGSYPSDDVQFLLTLLPPQPDISVAQKERLIQSGQRHYSQMLSMERAPASAYQNLFQQACEHNGARMAADCLTLAALIAQHKPGPLALVSLMRGGTPLGVILKRLLAKWLGRAVEHFSLSILRDRGIDERALQYILQQGISDQSLVFIDGWTGKGTIARELAASIEVFNREHNRQVPSALYSLVDLAGVSLGAASAEDYLLPCSILNATVSGLLSRSVVTEQLSPTDFHGAVYYQHLAGADVSTWFVDFICQQAQKLLSSQPDPAYWAALAPNTKVVAARSRQFIQQLQQTFSIADSNLIKPGIGEATRVLLRRAPRLLLLRDATATEVTHLRLLAQDLNVPIQEDNQMPYHAVSLIKSSPDG